MALRVLDQLVDDGVDNVVHLGEEILVDGDLPAGVCATQAGRVSEARVVLDAEGGRERRRTVVRVRDQVHVDLARDDAVLLVLDGVVRGGAVVVGGRVRIRGLLTGRAALAEHGRGGAAARAERPAPKNNERSAVGARCGLFLGGSGVPRRESGCPRPSTTLRRSRRAPRKRGCASSWSVAGCPKVTETASRTPAIPTDTTRITNYLY